MSEGRWLVLGAQFVVAGLRGPRHGGGGRSDPGRRRYRDIDLIASDVRIRGDGRVEVRSFDAAIDRAGHAAFVADLPRAR